MLFLSILYEEQEEGLFVHYPNNILNINYQEDFTGGTLIGNSVFFKDNGNSYISSGNIGIGSTNPNNELNVNGTIHSKEVKVDMEG